MNNFISIDFKKKKNLWIGIGVSLILYILPQFVANEYFMRIGVLSCLYALLSISLNLIAGVCGQVSMGHAAFFGIGSYASALVSMKLGMPWLVCVLIAFVISYLAGFIVGYPSLRLTGGYLAICTLGFGELIRIIMLNWVSLTRGPMGLVNIPRPIIFGIKIKSSASYFYICLTILIISYIILNNIINSKFGRNIKAIKNDDTAAEAMGVNVHMHKVISFAIAAAFAGIAGSILAHYFIFIEPSAFVGDESTSILSMVVLGGMGSMPGAVISATVLTALPEILRGFSQYRLLIYGFLLIFMMLAKTFSWETTPLYHKIKEWKLKLRIGSNS